MKRFIFTFLSISALSAAALAATELQPYVGGRAVAAKTGEDTSWTYQWPGVYFEGRFTGDSIDVKVDDAENNLYVYVDGAHKLTLTRPGKTTVALKDLGPGEHTVRLEKSSETQEKTATFDGFFVPAPDNALPSPSYQRRIEFIGDSYTVGYGVQSRGQTCTVQDVYDTTDTSAAFAPMIAKRFGAAYRINAFSGRGVVRNYDGIVPGVTLPVLYPYALFDRSVKADDSGWTPDVVVIGLGTNDFSTPLNPGEKWATREAERVDFVNTYASFVKSLHARWPGAHIILMASTGYEHEIEEAVNATSQTLHDQGLDVEVIVFAGLDYQACDGHPSLKDETVLSQLLYESISQLPKFAGVGATP